jgi:hypothetical protein
MEEEGEVGGEEGEVNDKLEYDDPGGLLEIQEKVRERFENEVRRICADADLAICAGA